jgi:D-3-phosphoglycerate dehydrogenase
MKVLFVGGRWAQQLEEEDALAKVTDFDVIAPQNQEQICEKAKDADIIVTSYPISSQVIKSAKNLKMIQVITVGHENIDMDAAAECGVVVCNSAMANANNVAELAFGLMIDVARRISLHNSLMHAGGWGRAGTGLETEISGKTLGIVGLGAIGSRMAQIGFLAFQMKVIACDPYVLGERARQFNAKLVDMDTVFREADIVSVHVPQSKETTHLVGKKQFDLMKPTAIFINTSRGPIVDEEALVDALKSKKIAGAGLDVFDIEPLPKDSPLREIENVVLVPHIGTTQETLRNMRRIAVENAIRVAKGMEPRRIVNSEVYYRSKKWFPA